MRRGQLIVLESTTYPGTRDELMVPILEKSGLKLDKDFFVAFSPEREDPNNKDFRAETIPKVVGATSPDGLAVADTLYRQIVVRTVPVSSTRVAEATKLMENIFRSVNIALVNELKMAFMKMDIDVWEVIESAKTKPFGFMPFYPGPGLGGHCLPIDPFYACVCGAEVMDALNEVGKPLKGSRVLIFGLAYKANVDDDRESPSYELMKELEEKGAIVDYNDPFVPVIRMTREHPQFAGRKSVEISKNYDLILISTAHDEYRKIDFKSFNIPVVDTRNLVRTVSRYSSGLR